MEITPKLTLEIVAKLRTAGAWHMHVKQKTKTAVVISGAIAADEDGQQVIATFDAHLFGDIRVNDSDIEDGVLYGTKQLEHTAPVAGWLTSVGVLIPKSMSPRSYHYVYGHMRAIENILTRHFTLAK